MARAQGLSRPGVGPPRGITNSVARLSVRAASRALAGGVIGSSSPLISSVGTPLRAPWFSALAGGARPQAALRGTPSDPRAYGILAALAVGQGVTCLTLLRWRLRAR